MAKITIELPDHMVQHFLGVFANGAEQMHMEAYVDHEARQGDFISFDYPGWKDRIVITEHKD